MKMTVLLHKTALVNFPMATTVVKIFCLLKDKSSFHSTRFLNLFFCLFQIDLDVNRTYRDHDMFRDRYNIRQNALFHVLAAYSVYNTEVGYCQVGKLENSYEKYLP